MDTLYGRGAGYRGKHATLTHDRIAQVGIRGGKFGTHDASIAAQVEQGAGLLTAETVSMGSQTMAILRDGPDARFFGHL